MTNKATEAKEIPSFDRGQPVTIAVAWDAYPVNVFFSYIMPGEEISIVDDGYGEPLSNIEKVADDVYSFVIQTNKFKAGTCSWHFWGETLGVVVVSKFGKFCINDAPSQLL